jgi:hypothetical protein
MTVSWRRSAEVISAGSEGPKAFLGVVSGGGALSKAVGPSRRAEIAASSLRRWPTRLTPRSLRSSAVSSRRTSASIALSRNADAYCSSPSPRSHLVISVAIAGIRDHKRKLSRPGQRRPLALIAESKRSSEAVWRATCGPQSPSRSIGSTYVTEAI